MSIRKKASVVLCVFLAGCLFTCAGCKNSEHTNSITANESKVSSGRIQSSNATQHIKKELDTNLTVDADIISPEKNIYSTYPMSYQSLTAKELTDIFLKNYSGKKNAQIFHSGVLNVSTPNGASISANRRSINFKGSKRDSAIDSIFNEYIRTHKDNLPPSKDLSFTTHGDAEKKAEEVLQSLKLSCEPAESPEVIAMTGQELQNYQAELLKNPDYKNTAKLVTVSDWSKKDDAYFIRFSFQKDRLPVYSEINETTVYKYGQDSVIPMPMVARMLITSRGLCYLDVDEALSLSGNPSASTSIITLDKALECLKNRYANVILASPYIVKKGWLEYVSVQDPNTNYENAVFTLTPYWCFQVDSVQNKKHTSTTERFNAFTGKDLAYGG